MFLASYPREVAQPHAPMPPCFDDDEQTDCEASVPGTPRGRGLFSTKCLRSKEFGILPGIKFAATCKRAMADRFARAFGAIVKHARIHIE